jgi:rubrerythrin
MDDATKQMAEGVRKAHEAEIEGYHFYLMAAKSTLDPTGRKVFERFAQDELMHAEYLKRQYASLMEHGKGDADALLDMTAKPEADSPIFSDAIKDRVNSAHFEMTALAVGTQLELSAIRFYKDQADAATDPTVAEFFNQLATWEASHYHSMLAQQEQLRAEYWTDNQFSPF